MKNLPAMWEIWVYSLCPDRPWRRARQPIPVFLLVEFHGQRRLADYIVCGVAEWDPAEGPALTVTCVSPLASAYSAGDPGSIPGSGRSPGEGNGNPLQYSCLENPMDGGAWWATVHGVTQSRTRLSNFTFFLSLSPARTCHESWDHRQQPPSPE